MGSKQLIVDELLAFIVHTKDTTDEISLVQICKFHFTAEEICRSKTLLYEVLGKTAQITSRRRDDKGENLQDIIKLIQETDPVDVPTFVAEQLSKLPPVTFDHIDVNRLLKDFKALRTSLSQMECRLESSETTIQELRAELLQLKSNNSECRSPPVASNINTRRGAQNASIGSFESAKFESPPVAAPRDAMRPAARSSPREELISQHSTSTLSRAYADVAAPPIVAQSRRSITQGKINSLSIKAAKIGPHKDLCDEEGFIKVERKKKKKKPICRNHLGSAPTGQNHLLRPEVKSTQLYVSRLHWSTKVEDVVNYVLKKSNFTLRVERLVSRHKVNFNSFVVRVPTHHLEKFLKEDFWPQGVVFRKFRGRLPADTARLTSPTLRVT